MNENLKLWIRVLFSQEYPQGRRALQGPGDGFCCLGVGCDLLVNAQPEKFSWGPIDLTRRNSRRLVIDGDMEGAFHTSAPLEFYEWIGKPDWADTKESREYLLQFCSNEKFKSDFLDEEVSDFGHLTVSSVLMYMNDSELMTHREIASFIQKLANHEEQANAQT